jgi:diketogulonate reductase-like aldo/keto reductase
VLTLKSNQNVTPLLQHEKVVELAKKYGKSSGQILLRWLVQRNVVVKNHEIRIIDVNQDRI